MYLCAIIAFVTAKTETTLYRIENPNIPAKPDGITSHPDLIGQWFTPDLGAAMHYLRKSTQTFGKGGSVLDGARLLTVSIPDEELGKYHVSNNPTARDMDVEQDNYLIPRDGRIEPEELALDGLIGELRGRLADPRKLIEARKRIEDNLKLAA